MSTFALSVLLRHCRSPTSRGAVTWQPFTETADLKPNPAQFSTNNADAQKLPAVEVGQAKALAASQDVGAVTAADGKDVSKKKKKKQAMEMLEFEQMPE